MKHTSLSKRQRKPLNIQTGDIEKKPGKLRIHALTIDQQSRFLLFFTVVVYGSTKKSDTVKEFNVGMTLASKLPPDPTFWSFADSVTGTWSWK